MDWYRLVQTGTYKRPRIFFVWKLTSSRGMYCLLLFFYWGGGGGGFVVMSEVVCDSNQSVRDSKLMTVERPGDWSAYGVSVRTEEASSA